MTKLRVPVSPTSDIFEEIEVDDDLIAKLKDFGTDPAIKMVIRLHLYDLAAQQYLKRVIEQAAQRLSEILFEKEA